MNLSLFRKTLYVMASVLVCALLGYKAYAGEPPSESEIKTKTEIETEQAVITKKERPQVNLSDEFIEELMAEMIFVEGGSFTMGSDSPEATKRVKPAHTVEVKDFYLARTELTQKVFMTVMKWNTSYFACDECPLNNVSWFQYQIFLKRLNQATGKKFRLPTEAEWEYAARGGNKSKGYKFSGSDNIDDVAWYVGNSNNKSHPVALKKPNELGFYDMTGNMWEFCHDDMSLNGYTSKQHITAEEVYTDDLKRKALKVTRGSGYEFSLEESYVYKRDGATNNVRMPDIGFRLALSEK